MGTSEEYSQKISEFYALLNLEKKAEGTVLLPMPGDRTVNIIQESGIASVSIPSSAVQGPESTVHRLRFRPSLSERVEDHAGCLSVLLDYLSTYIPYSRKARPLPSRCYNLKAGPQALQLSISEEIDWGEGENIDILYNPGINLITLKEVKEILSNRRVSSFVWGRLIEENTQGDYTILRRFYKE